MPPKPKDIDDYLSRVSDEQRAVLQELRAAIQAAAPAAEECISYQLPAFRLDGRMLVAFGAAAHHCAIYPGAYSVEVCQAELTGYSTSKGTVRFRPDQPVPAPLVRKLVEARIAQRRELAKPAPAVRTRAPRRAS